MAHKILEQFRRLPNFGLVQKIQDKMTRPAEGVACQLSSIYGGAPKEPTCFDYDEKLSLLAVGTNLGLINVYGAPGVTFEVTGMEVGVVSIKFIQEEGRLIAATKDNHLILFELNSVKGVWERKFAVLLPQAKANEQITCIALGKGVVYVGSSQGSVRQVALHEGKMMLGDELTNTLTTESICRNVPLEKREELGLDSSVVSLEVHTDAQSLLVAFSGGTVAVAKVFSTEKEETVVEENSDEVKNGHTEDEKENEKVNESPAATTNEEPNANEEIDVKKTSCTMAPVSGSKLAESNMLRKSRTMTMFASGQHDQNKCKHGHFEQPDLKLPKAPKVTHFLPRGQSVHSASWRYCPGNGKEVIVAYGDGAHQVWSVHDDPGEVEKEEPIIVTNKYPANIPYGPMPCCAIEKVFVHHSKSGLITAFTGGMPRASFSEMYTVSVLRDQQQHVCFRFSAPIVDFKLISVGGSVAGVTHLAALSQNELVMIDLSKPDWPQVTNPYLSSFEHVTSLAHIDRVPVVLINQLVESRRGKMCSWSEWPIKGGGGETGEIDMSKGDVLALGHESGLISLWFIGQGGMCLSLGAIHTSSLFVEQAVVEEEESWPPFRRVGCGFQSAQDSLPVGLAVRFLQLQVTADSGDLVVISGGDLGQISIWSTGKSISDRFEPDVSRIVIDLATEEELKTRNFEWNGPTALKPKEGFLNSSPHKSSFKVTTFLQFTPPSPIRSVEVEQKWLQGGLLACASCHGFALVQLEHPNTVLHRSFTPFLGNYAQYSLPLVEAGQEAVSDVTATFKTKSRMLKSSLRQSFKKLKKMASTTQPPSTVPEENGNGVSVESAKEEETVAVVVAVTAAEGDVVAVEPSTSKEEEAAAPVVVPVVDEEEEKPQPPTQLLPALKAWSVRTLKLASIPLDSEEEDKLVPSLLVGTDAGLVSIYSLLPLFAADQKTTDELKLCKELKLQHGAPIVGLFVLNSKDRFSPLLENISMEEVKKVKEQEPIKTEENGETVQEEAATVAVSYDLLVCTEEQLKLFSLPSLKPKHKYKFVMNLPHLPHHSKTEESASSENVAVNGCCDEKRVRSVALQLICSDWYVVCSLSNCQVMVLSLPHLRRQMKNACCPPSSGEQPCACSTAIGSGNAHVAICVCDGGRAVCLSELCSTSVHLAAKQKDVITLPEWARPGQQQPAPAPRASIIAEEEKSAMDEVKTAVSIVPETVAKLTEEVVEKTKTTIAEVVNNEIEKSILNGTQLGDMTHDVVTDYLSNDSTNVSVKTVEHSTEKRTLIKGGEMVTTVRETKKIDGKIVEDDSIKLSSVKQEN